MYRGLKGRILNCGDQSIEALQGSNRVCRSYNLSQYPRDTSTLLHHQTVMLNSFQEVYCDEITFQQLFLEPSLVISLERSSQLAPFSCGLFYSNEEALFFCGFIHHSLKTAIVEFTKRSFVLDSLRLTSIPLFFFWFCFFLMILLQWCKKRLSSSFADRLYPIYCNNIAPYKRI